jgi:protein-L-isoaspartate O-methyltransferase
MVDKMKRFGIISSDHVERGFRRVDRKFFVPRGNEDSAHSDQPLKEGNVHISAPHIYGSVIEALALVPNSCTSFLNIGSGTGYVSCIVAEILGPNSLNYGVELHADVIEHCKSSIAKWKTNVVDEQGDNSTIHFMTDTADIQIIKGNGLDIINSKGESVVGFDRIYIGAAVDKDALANISKLLSPGGILVGPVDDELVKIERVGNVSSDVEGEMEHEDGARSISGLSREFTSQILSGVRFAPLTNSRSMVQTVIPAHVWNPSVQRMYPSEFKRASMHLLMCSNSELVQPLPTTPRPDERVNVAAMLPKSIWVEILSFTHRKWF